MESGRVCPEANRRQIGQGGILSLLGAAFFVRHLLHFSAALWMRARRLEFTNRRDDKFHETTEMDLKYVLAADSF